MKDNSKELSKMIKSPEIKVNPNVLKTLRENSGYTVGEIARIDIFFNEI
jgi:hypothetical protein